MPPFQKILMLASFQDYQSELLFSSVSKDIMKKEVIVLLWIILTVNTIHLKQEHTTVDLPAGSVALRADNGQYAGICHNCGNGAYADSVSLKSSPEAWTLEVVGDQVAFLGSNGNYLSWCSGCWRSGAAYPDSAFAHISKDKGPITYTPVRQPNGKYTFKAVNGKYLSRCENCVKNNPQVNFVFVHETNPSVAAAQWDVEYLNSNVPPNPAPASNPPPVSSNDGLKAGSVALRGDLGEYASICHNCGQGAYPDSVAFSLSPEAWILELVGDKVAFKGKNGNYLSRCSGCWRSGAAYSDSAFAHVSQLYGPTTWTPIRQPNGKYAFKSDNGKYLSRCENCVRNNPRVMFVFVHETDPSIAPAQWDIIYLNQTAPPNPPPVPTPTPAPVPAAAPANNGLKNGSVTIQADDGQYVSICHECGNGAYLDSVSLKNTPETWILEIIGVQIAFKGKNGHYLSRCNQCWKSGALYPDSAFAHISKIQPYSLWTPISRPNGKYCFKSDNGKYLARCQKCVTGNSHPRNFAFVHEDSPESDRAQWTIAYIDPSEIDEDQSESEQPKSEQSESEQSESEQYIPISQKTLPKAKNHPKKYINPHKGQNQNHSTHPTIIQTSKTTTKYEFKNFPTAAFISPLFDPQEELDPSSVLFIKPVGQATKLEPLTDASNIPISSLTTFISAPSSNLPQNTFVSAPGKRPQKLFISAPPPSVPQTTFVQIPTANGISNTSSIILKNIPPTAPLNSPSTPNSPNSPSTLSIPNTQIKLPTTTTTITNLPATTVVQITVTLSAGFVGLRADDGEYLSICTNCGSGVYPDSASLSSTLQEWTLEVVGTQVAFKGSNGKYLSRCNSCWSGALYPDSAFVHVSKIQPYSLWTPVPQPNGKYCFKSDNGKYLSRCQNCVTGNSNLNFVFVHQNNPASAWAQWEVIYINPPKVVEQTLQADNGYYLKYCPTCEVNNAVSVSEGIDSNSLWTITHLGNKVVIKGANGNYISRCNGCWPEETYSDSVFVHLNNPNSPSSQWTAVKLANGKWAFQADSGKYLARCHKCANSGSPDLAFVYGNSSEEPQAQWKLQ